jgi:hypothetical protein
MATATFRTAPALARGVVYGIKTLLFTLPSANATSFSWEVLYGCEREDAGERECARAREREEGRVHARRGEREVSLFFFTMPSTTSLLVEAMQVEGREITGDRRSKRHDAGPHVRLGFK